MQQFLLLLCLGGLLAKQDLAGGNVDDADYLAKRLRRALGCKCDRECAVMNGILLGTIRRPEAAGNGMKSQRPKKSQASTDRSAILDVCSANVRVACNYAATVEF